MHSKLLPMSLTLSIASLLLACEKRNGTLSSQVNAEEIAGEYIEIESADFMKCSEMNIDKSMLNIKINYNDECYGYSFSQDFFRSDEMSGGFLVYVKDSYPDQSDMKSSSSDSQNPKLQTIADAYDLIKKAERLSAKNGMNLTARNRKAKRRACKAAAVIASIPGTTLDIMAAIGCAKTWTTASETMCNNPVRYGKDTYNAVLRACHVSN
ncbi:MAG: hypothetical protein HQK54_16285 [Oligoflexales bacterium]|nr:hypothetical protein [Oligoflexales bacterium]